MKRLCSLLVLLVAASSAHADSISFSLAGHRIRVDAPRNCRSTSCASISIPGVYESRRKRWDDEEREVVAAPPPPATSAPVPPVQQAPPPAPIPSPSQQVTPPAAPAVVAPPAPASRLTVVMVPAPTPLAVYKPAATTTQEVAPPPVIKPMDVKPAAPLLNVLREDEQADSPIGDWQTENKGLVRIVECGRALCGYAIKPGEDEKGEAVLINMKPKTAAQWNGSVYSKDSGDTYYGTVNLNGPNTLRVEACAVGRFYCNGNHWTRVPPRTDRVITSRQMDTQPRT